MVEEDPGLVEDQQGWPSLEPCFKPMEQIGQHRRNHACLPHERLGLETSHIGKGELLLGRVEQAAIGPVERIGPERGRQRIGLEQ